MADRVFPNSVNVDMGSKLEFNGIDWSAVQASITNNRFADDKTDQVVALLADAGYDLNPGQVNELDRVIQTATNVGQEGDLGGDSDNLDHDMSDVDRMGDLGDTEPGMDGFDDMGDMSLGYGDDDDEFGDSPAMDGQFQRESTTTKNMKRIAFTSQEQISADAIETALAKGDTKLVNTILAARKENRNRIAAAIKEKANSEMNKYASKSDSKNKRSASESKNQAEVTTEFVSPAKFTRAQRDSFKRIAIASGMPKEYVEAMCGVTPLNPQLESLSDSIKKVYSMDLAQNVKQATIKTLIKEAKLSPDSKSEFIRYWNEVLGYQDKSFWPDVAADYTAGKKTAQSKTNTKK
jgi:hypothetical protein